MHALEARYQYIGFSAVSADFRYQPSVNSISPCLRKKAKGDNANQPAEVIEACSEHQIANNFIAQVVEQSWP